MFHSFVVAKWPSDSAAMTCRKEVILSLSTDDKPLRELLG